MADRFGGGTSRSEKVLEEKRQLIRTALKHEFIQKRYAPKSFEHAPVVFDAALQRWTALQFTKSEFFVPSLRNFAKYSMLVFAPIAAFRYAAFGPTKKQWLKDIREGRVPLEHVDRRRVYALWM